MAASLSRMYEPVFSCRAVAVPMPSISAMDRFMRSGSVGATWNRPSMKCFTKAGGVAFQVADCSGHAQGAERLGHRPHKVGDVLEQVRYGLMPCSGHLVIHVMRRIVKHA